MGWGGLGWSGMGRGQGGIVPGGPGQSMQGRAGQDRAGMGRVPPIALPYHSSSNTIHAFTYLPTYLNIYPTQQYPVLTYTILTLPHYH